MKCIDSEELKRYLNGNISSNRLMEIEQHIYNCTKCRSTILNMPDFQKISARLGAELLDVSDCPEYDELSNYVDGTIAEERLSALTAHINSCELCTADVNRIRELRAQASLREKIEVKPGKYARRSSNPFVLWKKVVACISMATVAAAVVVMMSNVGNSPTQQVSPNVTNQAVRKNENVIKSNEQVKLADKQIVDKSAQVNEKVVASKPTNISNKSDIYKPNAALKSSQPSYKTLLKDGNYIVIKKDGKILMAKADGTPINQSYKITEKLLNKKVRPLQSVVLAMSHIAYRAGEAYKPPVNAPVLINPKAKIIISDKPTFNWSNVKLSNAYKLEITDESGNLIFESVTRNTSLTINKALPRGMNYIWRVGVRFSEDDEWIYSAAEKFRILPSEHLEAIEKVKKEMPGSHLALGSIYEYYGLIDEAMEQYRMLRRANPDSELASEILHKTVNN